MAAIDQPGIPYVVMFTVRVDCDEANDKKMIKAVSYVWIEQAWK